MNASTRNNLKVWAIAWETTRAAPDYPSQYQQKAIAIHKLLSDGNWHNAKDIAKVVGLSTGTTLDLVQALKEPFGLASHTRRGYMMELNRSKSD
jgi:hypothetical protein